MRQISNKEHRPEIIGMKQISNTEVECRNAEVWNADKIDWGKELGD
jgi:hypothetical protein